MCEDVSPLMLSRCHLYVGIGAHCKAVSLHVKSTKDEYHALAHESLLKLVLPYFHVFSFCATD